MGVILTYNTNPGSANHIVNSIVERGGEAVALKLEVADSSSFRAFSDAVRTALQTTWDRADFDYLVNNAGYGLFSPIAKVTEDEFDGLFNVHLKGPFFLTQTLLPLITDGGQIVNLTSATTRVTTAGVAPYASFKGGLEVLTRYMAQEFGDRRIRVNAISPGPIRTELGGGLNDEFQALLSAQTALGRVGEPEDVASAIVRLLSDDNR
jgi:NAD(P)-dependent dehydrogenase (short-subunit alcohol dehydrogenase family)